MNKTGKNNRDTPRSLCWDCKNATRPDVCSWTDNFTPVPGWKAKPSKIYGAHPIDSYTVLECPRFKRDSFGAGAEECLLTLHRPIKLCDDDLINLAEAVIENAVEDWKALQYGALKHTNFRDAHITRKQTLEFFFSADFENYLSTFSELTPEQIRSWLKIDENMNPFTVTA